jgi:hypothetical protein
MDLRESLFALAGSLKQATVDVPGIGSVVVRELDGYGRAEIEHAMVERKDDPARWRLLLVARSVYNPETNALVFSDADVPKLGRLPWHVLEPVFAAAFRLSGMAPDDIEEAKGN